VGRIKLRKWDRTVPPVRKREGSPPSQRGSAVLQKAQGRRQSKSELRVGWQNQGTWTIQMGKDVVIKENEDECGEVAQEKRVMGGPEKTKVRG